MRHHLWLDEQKFDVHLKLDGCQVLTTQNFYFNYFLLTKSPESVYFLHFFWSFQHIAHKAHSHTVCLPINQSEHVILYAPSPPKKNFFFGILKCDV